MPRRFFPRTRPPRPARRGLSSLLLVALAFAAARAERLPVRVYTTADGLGSSAVNWILRDSRGFLWFCTRDGLSRFDGQRFATYHIAGASGDIAQIIERRRGDYIALTQYGVVYRFDERTAASPEGDAPADAGLVLHADRLAEGARGILYEDGGGRLWLGTLDAGLFLFEESGGRLTRRQVNLDVGGRPVTVTHIVESRDGCLWLSTSLGLVRRAPDGRTALFSTPPSSAVENFLSDILEDADGRLWVGSRRGVFVIKPLPPSDPAAFDGRPLAGRRRRGGRVTLPEAPGEVFEFTSRYGLDGNFVRAILQTADGRVWLTSTKGLSVFDGREFRSFDTANGLGVMLGTMAEDLDRNLWMASLNGAVKLVAHGLSTYGREDGLGDQAVRAIYQTAAGDLYVVEGDWWVSRLVGRRFVTARPRLREPGSPLWTSNAAMPDGAGAWWFTSERRLFRFEGVGSIERLAGLRPAAVYQTGPDFHDGAFYRVFEDSRGDVWVGTRSASPAHSGLSRWERATGAFHFYGPAEGFPEGRAPASFCEDRSGALWVGFYGGGLARYAGGRFQLLTAEDGLPEGFVTDLHLDGSGRLWVATSAGGVARVDDPAAARPSFARYTTADGLSSNNVRAVTEDEAGRIYFGTVRGLDRLSPDTGRVKHFTTADGLSDDFVTAAFRDRDGTLWFGTHSGLSRLSPEPDLPPREPPVLLGGLRVSGVRQPLSELGERRVGQLRLDYTQTNVEIDFFSLSFAPSERTRYQHMLEGADKEWSAPAAERSVTYAKLAPGTYRFLVRAVNADGVASAEPAVVSFRISPPFWERWWFLAGVALLFGLGIYAAARARFRRKLELERVRTRIATDLHDDIGASLTRISLLSEVANREEDGARPEASRRLTQIADDARSLVDSMSDIVWAIDPRRDDFLSVVERVRSFAADTLGAAGVRWQMTVAPQLPGRHLTPEQRRAIYLIFKEAVSNIVRHSGCRNASCHISFDHHTLVAAVEDDGCGLPQNGDGGAHVGVSNGRGGRGLANMRARAAELGGRLEAGPREGGGTRLLLRLPLNPYGMNMFLRPARSWFKMRN